MAPLGSDPSNHTMGWSEVAAPPVGFGVGGGMIADTPLGMSFVFGGEDSGRLVNTTFAYTEAANSWSTVLARNSPSPRSDFAFAVDPAAGTGVAFGGLTNLSSLAVSNETWAYDVSTRRWTPETQAAAPPAREAAAFAIDPSLGVGLLYGGWNRDYSSTQSITYSDLWELNLTTFAWSRVSVGGARPPPLEGASFAWDPSTLRFDLYGGCYPCSSAVWQFDPGSLRWTELSTPADAPAAGGGASWAYDPVLRADLLFGGTNGAVAFNDTYLFFPVNDTWAIQTLPPGPSARSAAVDGFLDVPGNETWLVAGGESGSLSYSDLWRLSATSNLSLRVVNASSLQSPLAGAQVNLSGRAAGFTDVEGYLNLTQINGVGPVLNVSEFFYYPSNATLWLPPGHSTRLTVDLVPEPPGAVFVTVLSALGSPRPGTLVNLSVDRIRVDQGFTNSSGNLSFYGVPPGRLNLSTSLADWRPGFANTVLAPGAILTQNILLVPDPVLAVTLLGRFPGGIVTPLAGSPVSLNGTLFGYTDQFGEVTAPTAAFGYVFLAAETPGYYYNVAALVIPWTGSLSATLVLASLPFGRISVSVLRLADGSPIGGAIVNASSTTPLPSGWYNETNGTDGAGLAGLALPQGIYFVAAAAVGYVPSAPVTVTVNASSYQALNIYLRPVPRANVHFHIRDAQSGEPIAGANVTDSIALAGRTDGSGFFNATNLTPGTYLFTESAPGYLSNVTQLTLRSSENLTLVVNLTRAPLGPASGWTFNLFPAGLGDLWAYLAVPLLFVVGGLVYASALRSSRRDDVPDPPLVEAARNEGRSGPAPQPGATTLDPPVGAQ